MLCRALVTAIAISCTFTREVIGQGTPRKHKKDLMCVLWLSGMQKEDMDVTLLRKLQRHNVNIDDISTDKMRQDCLNITPSKDNVTDKVESTVTSERESDTTTLVTKLSTDSVINKMIQRDLTLILTEIMGKKTLLMGDIRKPTKEKVNSDHVPFKNDSIARDIASIVNEKTTLLPISTETTMAYNKENDYENNQANLEKVFQFWQMFTSTHKQLPNNDVTTISTTAQLKTVTSEILSKETKTLEYISKLLADFVNKSSDPTTAKPTTADSTPTPSVEFMKLSQHIEKILNLIPKNAKITESNIFQQNEKISKIMDFIPNEKIFNIEDGLPQKSFIVAERIRQYQNYDPNAGSSRNIKDLEYFNFDPDTLLKTVNPNYVTQTPNLYNGKGNDHEFRYTPDISSKRPTTQVPLNSDQTLNNDTKNSDTKIFSKEVLQNIADGVKALVLQDLRSNMSTITPLVANVTRSGSTQAPSSQTQSLHNLNTTQDRTQVMQKFIDLFEQFKIFKDKTTEASTKINYYNKSNTWQEINSPINSQNPMLIVDPNGGKKPPSNIPEYYSSFGVQSLPMGNTEIRLPINQANVVNLHPISYNANTNKLKNVPIMLQTNSGEIAPLGIPVSKPLQLIHQNIVVTTTKPLLLYKEHREPWSTSHKYETNFKDVTGISKERLFNYHFAPPSLPVHAKKGLFDQRTYKTAIEPYEDTSYKYSRFREQAKRPLYISRYEDIVNSKLKREYDDRKLYSREKQRYDKIRYGTFTRGSHGERFHEKLERIDDGPRFYDNIIPDKRSDCYRGVKVVPRQQQPLNNAKKSPKFDDTHFRNFLKTQQKVNDMLERILATKTRPDGPPSVEST